MGSKNRIFLGLISSLMLHYHRNTYLSTKLFLSKKKSQKISVEHPSQSEYILNHTFQNIIDTTIASCRYKEDGVQNFISLIEGTYLIYGVSTNNYHNELTTIYKPSVRQLIKCKSSIKFFSEKYEVEYEEYIKN